MNHIIKQIRDNALSIEKMHNNIHETFKHRSRSQEDYERWSQACEIFHSRFCDLAFPQGIKGWNCFLSGESVSLESAITFLEADAYFYRSGYMKQIIWQKLKKFTLSIDDAVRLETVAKNYLHQQIRNEFWYMCRYVRLKGSASFWQTIEHLSQLCSEEGTKALWLVLAKKNSPVKNWVRQEKLRCKYDPNYIPDFRFKLKAA